MREMLQPLTKFFIYSIFILGFCASGFSEMCPEAAPEMGICLHTYLERDFTGLEPFLDFSDNTDGWRLLINGPELETECSKFLEMVKCYAELDGECYALDVRRRYSYLIHTLYRIYHWLCDNNKRLKILLENIACILRTQQDRICLPSALLPVNVWQRMLRLESGSETCRSLQEQVACLKRTGVIHRECGNNSHTIYVQGMEIWLEGWCIDDESSSTSSSRCRTSLVLIGLSICAWMLFRH